MPTCATYCRVPALEGGIFLCNQHKHRILWSNTIYTKEYMSWWFVLSDQPKSFFLGQLTRWELSSWFLGDMWSYMDKSRKGIPLEIATEIHVIPLYNATLVQMARESSQNWKVYHDWLNLWLCV